MLEYNLEFIKKYKISIIIGILMLFFCMSFYLFILNHEVKCNNVEEFVIISKGSSASSIGTLLQDNECFEDINIFKLALKITMNSKKIRPGRYDLKGVSSMRQLINTITSHPGDIIKVTIIEGWNIEQIANALHAKLKIDINEFKNLASSKSFIKEFGIISNSLEGYIFPDTYFLLKYYTEREIIEIFLNQFKKNYNDLIKEHSGGNNLSMEELVVLASIIQGEAMYIDEMPLISSVYHNRLRKNILLQADPTIQYIVPGKPRRLFNKDLKIDSPYNTYMYKGLPPGAINNPGIDALQSAMLPQESQYYYFVSNGEGRHVFSRTVDEHNLAKLQLKRKRKAMKKK